MNAANEMWAAGFDLNAATLKSLAAKVRAGRLTASEVAGHLREIANLLLKSADSLDSPEPGAN